MLAITLLAACGSRPPRAAPPPPPPQFLAINAAGAMVDVEAAVVLGYVNIIDFRADWCGACDVVDERLRAGVTGDARIVVRTVDVGDGQSLVAAAYGVRGLPHVLVIDRVGALRYRLVGNDALTVAEVARQLADEPTPSRH
jgi:thioredoxin 1